MASALLLFALPLGVVADSISYFPDETLTDLTPLINAFGLNNPDSESDGQSFVVPDANGDGSPVSVRASFISDTGDFLFTFGTFPVLAVAGLDAQANRFAWTEAALTHPQTMVVFDDDDIDPCSEPTVLVSSCQASFSGVPVGSEWFFFLIPNNNLETFREDPRGFYDRTAEICGEDYGSKCRKPLFSFTPANPGGFDQMLSFSGNGATLFSFEDLSRQGWSDTDYSDLVFVLDFPASDEVAFVANESQETREEPPPSSSVPAPSSLGLLLTGLVFGAWRPLAAPAARRVGAAHPRSWLMPMYRGAHRASGPW